MAEDAVPFALAPALVGGDDPIDYSTRAGQALYSSATAALPYIFEGRDSSVPAFLQAIRDRGAASGWTDIFEITIGHDNQGNDINQNLLTHYGEITLDDVKSNAIADYLNTPVRNAQVSAAIYQCLRKSIGTKVTERMVTEADSYHVNGTPDGPSFLMKIIEIYLIQTKGTPTQLRLDIAKAFELIVKVDYHIDTFNNSIQAIVQKLAANGETTQDLFAHLTKAYKKVPDRAFAIYITGKINSHNDGTNVLTAEQLMEYAKNKYDELVAENEWMIGDATEQQLIALTAQLEQVKMSNNNLRQQMRKQKGVQNKKMPNQDKTKRTNDAKWAWKMIAPKHGERTKVFEGKTYFWCKYHKKWTLHKSTECRLVKEGQAVNPNSQQDDANMQGLAAVLDFANNMSPFDHDL